MPSDNQILTPTYQAPLISALNAVIRKLMEAPPQETWKAMKAVYFFLPPECTPECTKQYTEICNQLLTISRIRTSDPLFQDSELAEQQAQYLTVTNLLFLDTIKESLFKHGYLRSDFSIKPRYENRPMVNIQ
jgi:hypothetical protein